MIDIHPAHEKANEIPHAHVEGSVVELPLDTDFAADILSVVEHTSGVGRSWQMAGNKQVSSISIKETPGIVYAVGVLHYEPTEDNSNYKPVRTQVVQLSALQGVGSLTIGRGDKNDVQVANDGVSFQHMQVTRTEDGYLQFDSSASNPVFVFELKKDEETIRDEKAGRATLDSVQVEEPLPEGLAVAGAVSEEPMQSEEADNGSEQEVALPLEQSKNILASHRALQDIVGENGKGGGLLGDTMREYAGAELDISQVQELLDKQSGSDELREKIRRTLRIRLEQLTGQNPPLFGIDVENDLQEKAVPGGFDYDDPKMPSRDYVTALALAKLDGSFDTDKGDFYSAKTDGQHRKAAEILLSNFAAEQVQDAPEAYDANLENEQVRVLNLAYTQARDLWVNTLTRTGHAMDGVREIVFRNYIDTDDILSNGYHIVGQLQNIASELNSFSARIMQSEIAQSDPNRAEQAYGRLRVWANQLDELTDQTRRMFINPLMTDQSMGTINQIRAYINRDLEQMMEKYNKIRSELHESDRIL